MEREKKRKEEEERRKKQEEEDRKLYVKQSLVLSLKPKMFILLVKHISSTYLTHRPKIFILMILRPIISKYNVAGR